MKLDITSYRGIPYRHLLKYVNNYFIEERKRLDVLKQVIVSEKKGLIVTVQKSGLRFESIDTIDGQEDDVKRFLQKVFVNKTIGYRSNDSCDWLEELPSIQTFKLN